MNLSQPIKISIIIPLFNKKKAILDTVNSCLKQDYQNIEIIIIDDGSTDDSAEVVNTLKSDCVKYYHQTNQGVSAARNLGIKYASGDFVMFLDADDLLLPDAVSTLMFNINNFNVDISAGNFFYESEGKRTLYSKWANTKIIKNCYKSDLLQQFTLCPGNYIARKVIFENISFSTKYKRHEDTELAHQLYELPYSYSFTKKPVFRYMRSHSVASSNYSNIHIDYISNLNFKNASFWKKMVLCRLITEGIRGYVYERDNILSLYPNYIFFNLIKATIVFLNSIKRNITKFFCR